MTDTLDDIAAQQRTEDRIIREDAELLRSLITHPGWKRYLALVEAVGQNFYTTLITPCENSFEWPKMEFAKGALTALDHVAKLPSIKIKQADELHTSTDSDEE